MLIIWGNVGTKLLIRWYDALNRISTNSSPCILTNTSMNRWTPDFSAQRTLQKTCNLIGSYSCARSW